MSTNPLLPLLDLTSLRLVSCGGSPQPPAVVMRCIAELGCEFFVSYGMTECCGKISMSILPDAWWNERAGIIAQQHGQPLDASPLSISTSASARRIIHDLVCTSGRPFALLDVRVVKLPSESEEDSQEEGQRPPEADLWPDVVPGSGEVGEVWCRGPTVFSGEQGFEAAREWVLLFSLPIFLSPFQSVPVCA